MDDWEKRAKEMEKPENLENPEKWESMEDRAKKYDRKKAAPVFDSMDPWKLKAVLMRSDDWEKANERLGALSAQNTDALIEVFNLGFLAGVHFTQDTYEKERQK